MVVRAVLGGGPRPHDLDRVPGPKGLPVIGNLLDIGHSRVHQTISGWAKQWPAYKFNLLFFKNVVLTDPTDIQPLVGKGGQELPRAVDIFYRPFNEIGGPARKPSLVTTKRPEVWAEVRRACTPAFSPENIRKTFPVTREAVSSVCDELAARMAQQVQQAGQQQPQQAQQQEWEGVEMCDITMRVALDVIGISLFARDFGASRFEECPVLEELPLALEEISLRALNPLRVVAQTLMPWTQEAREFSARLTAAHELWAELAREIRAIDLEEADARGDTTLRTCLARVKDPATGELLPEEDLAPHIATFLVAAFESTAHSVAWALYELARDPQAQSKVAAELAAAGLLGEGGRQLEYADLAALPFLDQVWKETLRLHPAGSVVPIREADREVVLANGARIPKGTFIWMPIVAVHLSPFNFVDPDRFWPERWEQQAQQAQQGGSQQGEASAEGEASESKCPFARWGAGHATPSGNSAAPNASYIPFSLGPRDCIGKNMANVMGKAMLAVLCSRFAWDLGPSMRSAQAVRDAEVIRLTLQPGEGVWLHPRPREGQLDGAVSEGLEGAQQQQEEKQEALASALA